MATRNTARPISDVLFRFPNYQHPPPPTQPIFGVESMSLVFAVGTIVDDTLTGLRRSWDLYDFSDCSF